MPKTKNKKIGGSVGFIGQGYVGKNMADDFERRGLRVVRYSLEEPYIKNKELIKNCPVVFVAVPTPTRKRVFDLSIVESSLKLLSPGAIAVIKSTVLPGSTRKLQKKFPRLTLLCSPEFLSEKTAAFDAAHPHQVIIGYGAKSARSLKAARVVLSTLPKSEFNLICKGEEAELFKYAHNANGYFQVILSNLLYDLGQKLRCDWEVIAQMIEADPLISSRYARPLHKGGRGAGGHCFIKDFEALFSLYRKKVGDRLGDKVFESLRDKNVKLLRQSGKSLDILRGVYGP